MHLVMAGTTSPSHVYPSLALIFELVSRGHRVSYLVGERLAGLVTPTGAELITHPTVLPDADTAWPQDTGEAMQIFLDEAIAVLPRLDDVDRPDAVLYDIGGFAGRVAAHRWGVPAVQLSPTYVAWEGYEEDMAEHTVALKSSASGRRYFASLRAWLDENGVELSADDFLGRPDSCVVLIPRVLQPNDKPVGKHCVFAGPCIDERRITGWEPPAGDDRPLVYMSFGTAYTDQAGIYRDCIQGLAGGYRLALATGKVDPAALGRQPGGVQASRTQPQLDLLAHADAFITHAGMGSAAESLWFGVPTVAIPQAVDQFANAARLEHIGAGVHLPAEEVDPGRVREAVEAALAKAPRARELMAEVRRGGGVGVAADAVERLARSTAAPAS